MLYNAALHILQVASAESQKPSLLIRVDLELVTSNAKELLLYQKMVYVRPQPVHNAQVPHTSGVNGCVCIVSIPTPSFISFFILCIKSTTSPYKARVFITKNLAGCSLESDVVFLQLAGVSAS